MRLHTAHLSDSTGTHARFTGDGEGAAATKAGAAAVGGDAGAISCGGCLIRALVNEKTI